MAVSSQLRLQKNNFEIDKESKMKMKQTCVKKTTSVDGRETELKISRICFREIKTVRHHQCLQSRNHCSRQWWFLQFPCLLEDFFCLFVSRLIVTTAYQSPFFLSDLLPFGLYFIIYLAIILSVRSIRTIFSTFPVLISSKNSFGKFSPVKLTFCVFFGKNIFLKF